MTKLSNSHPSGTTLPFYHNLIGKATKRCLLRLGSVSRPCPGRRLATAHFDLSAAVAFQVVDGRVKPDVRAIAAGVALPLPGAVLNPALNLVLSQMEDYLDQAYDFVEFDDVQIKDGCIVVTGHKQPDAPADQ